MNILNVISSVKILLLTDPTAMALVVAEPNTWCNDCASMLSPTLVAVPCAST